MAAGHTSGERSGVVYNAGDTVVADLFRPRSNNAYNYSTGVYTVQDDSKYTLNVFYLSNSSEATLTLVINCNTQPLSIWDTIGDFRNGHGGYWYVLKTKKFEMNQGQTLQFQNTVNSTKYFEFSWTLYAPKA